MRSLNECLGDGRSIPIEYSNDSLVNQSLHEPSKDELIRVKKERAESAAKQCGRDVSKRYDGKPCMGTSIHSRTPSYLEHHKFFFDEEFMTKCLNAGSSSVEKLCAGSAYYKFVQSFFDSHYYIYDNGCEGIRNGCAEGNGQMCTYHKEIENVEQLHDHWKGKPTRRTLPPIPDYSDTEIKGFHYLTPSQVVEGKIFEKFQLRKEIAVDACKREIDDYCPRKQLEKLIDSCGAPILSCKEMQSDGSATVSVIDENSTLEKCLHKIDGFVDEYVGDDMRNTAVHELKRRHEMKVKATILKQETASAKAVEKAKVFEDLDWRTLVTTNTLNKLYVSQLNLYLTTKMGLSPSKCHAKGYTKNEKIEEIKKHYYSSQSMPKTSLVNSGPKAKQNVCITTLSIPPQQTSSLQKHTQSVRVLPWGGFILLRENGQTIKQLLKNTCPIDNYLAILYILMNDHSNLFQHLDSLFDDYARRLVEIKKMFDESRYSEGKILWLSLFPGRFNMNLPVLDLWGNEEDLFISRLQPAIVTHYTGSCSSHGCPTPSLHFKSYSIALRYGYFLRSIKVVIWGRSLIYEGCNHLANAEKTSMILQRRFWRCFNIKASRQKASPRRRSRNFFIYFRYMYCIYKRKYLAVQQLFQL